MERFSSGKDSFSGQMCFGYTRQIMCMMLCFFMPLCFMGCHNDDAPEINEKDITLLNLKIEGSDGFSLSGEVDWFTFGSYDELISVEHYASMETLQQTFNPTDPGYYTYVAVMNAGNEFALGKTRENGIATLEDLFERINVIKGHYPDMNSGLVRVGLEEGRIVETTIKIQKGMMQLPGLCLNLIIPRPISEEFSEIKNMTRASKSESSLRYIVEVYESKNNSCIQHRSFHGSPNDVSSMGSLSLQYLTPGCYDVLIWADYSEDNNDVYYQTSSLKSVNLDTEVGSIVGTAKRNAYFAHFTDNLEQPELITKEITLNHPFACYQILSTDIQRYEEIKRSNNYPEIEDVEATIIYNGYFPSAFNVWSGLPNDAIAGHTLKGDIVPTPDGEIIVTNDYVFVGDSRSSISVDIILTDKKTGKAFSVIKDIKINYKRGYRTTIRGNFLTAGINSGNLQIEENWDGEYDIEF